MGRGSPDRDRDRRDRDRDRKGDGYRSRDRRPAGGGGGGGRRGDSRDRRREPARRADSYDRRRGGGDRRDDRRDDRRRSPSRRRGGNDRRSRSRSRRRSPPRRSRSRSAKKAQGEKPPLSRGEAPPQAQGDSARMARFDNMVRKDAPSRPVPPQQPLVIPTIQLPAQAILSLRAEEARDLHYVRPVRAPVLQQETIPMKKMDYHEEPGKRYGGTRGVAAVPGMFGAPKKKGRVQRGGSSCSSSGSVQSVAGSNQDEIVHFEWKRGMILNNKYSLQKLMGDGTFGRVVQAKNCENGQEVAIKIIRDVKRYMENAKIEAEILQAIAKADPKGESGCGIMYETFVHAMNFYCLVFEPLGENLYEFMKANKFRGFWMQDLQNFSLQALKCLAFLQEKLKMTHTDLKPENLLLASRAPATESTFPREADWLKRNANSSKIQNPGPYMRPAANDIKIIDFGNATYAHEHHSSVINTRQYRGPEVLLEAGWDETSDIWSIGCILFELYAGEQLFATHEEMEHLALMQQIIGILPTHLLERAAKNVQQRYLVRNGPGWKLPWPERASSSSSQRHVNAQKPVQEQVPAEHKAFADFLTYMLELVPQKRPIAAQALQHPFFSVTFTD
eukprot:TRINITY_DN10778_c0_g1_i1.p1 TRINITY_DN10778_c0_g1~~TRINITY_DN10778_c0_g1_i1.p1  ORF type:complete len:617 (-),score=120.00 TRINITY_DN10778_c0_g1_i1:114-1964(-)